MIHLDFQQFQSSIKTKKVKSQSFIWDPVRMKYLVLQPEELVRQLFIQYLLQEHNYSKKLIQVEKGIKVGSLTKRFDIVLYNQSAKPVCLVECKRPQEKLKQSVFNQISNYNLALQVDYLIVTNGQRTFCCEMDYEKESYAFLPAIPNFS